MLLKLPISLLYRTLNVHIVHRVQKRLTFINMTSAIPAATPTADSTSSGPVKLDKFSFAKSQISALLDEPANQIRTQESGVLLQTLAEVAEYARSLEKALSDARRNSDDPSVPPLHSNSPPEDLHPEYSNEAPSTPFSHHQNSIPSDADIDDLADFVSGLELNGDSFFGHSSQVALSKMAMTIKNEYLEEETEVESKRRLFFKKGEADAGQADEPLDTLPNVHITDESERTLVKPSREIARAQFWDVYPWQRSLNPPQLKLNFPPSSLLNSLVDLYFTKHNFFWPLLHRPTFQRAIDTGLHERDRAFGELVLSVCALGARCSSDERVFADKVHISSQERQYSAGWKYITQINPMQEVTARNALYVVQTICNMIPFLTTTSTPYQCWVLLGVGVRHAQAVGAHRLKFFGAKPTVQQELWKRAFWVLVSLDMFSSVFSGRPPATDPAEYDLDMPIECDDEYWEHTDPEESFEQPSGRPSWVTYWTTWLKLLKILTITQKVIRFLILHTQYSLRKPTDLSPEDHVVQELNAALSHWVDEVPDHLRWDPNRANSLFFEQSSLLYCAYYFTQTHVHRPFIASVDSTVARNQLGKSQKRYSLMSYTSLAVCANAARSCLQILDMYSKKSHSSRAGNSPSIFASAHDTSDLGLSHFSPFPTVHFVFTFGIMILLNVWGAKHQGIKVERRRDRENVLQCLDLLKGYEKRHQLAGRMWSVCLLFVLCWPL
ncbi:hypothetical protein GYMLUDRAFT_383150 [Collybiopsis luxurians FD-317 M1]|nr:hypothetical protein GYMLUDRAFT_383150 [Collybiopsis luxurians FD-317 M1]